MLSAHGGSLCLGEGKSLLQLSVLLTSLSPVLAKSERYERQSEGNQVPWSESRAQRSSQLNNRETAIVGG